MEHIARFVWQERMNTTGNDMKTILNMFAGITEQAARSDMRNVRRWAFVPDARRGKRITERLNAKSVWRKMRYDTSIQP